MRAYCIGGNGLEGLYWRHSSDEEVEETLDKIVNWIFEKKLETPALLVFPTIKPLTLMGGGLSRIFIAPWLHFIGFNSRHYINSLEQPKNIEKLIEKIENKMKK